MFSSVLKDMMFNTLAICLLYILNEKIKRRTRTFFVNTLQKPCYFQQNYIISVFNEKMSDSCNIFWKMAETSKYNNELLMINVSF